MVFDPRQQSFNAPFVPSNIWPGRGRANCPYRRIKRSGFRKRKALAAGFSAKNDDIVLSFVVPAANTPSIRSESENFILSFTLSDSKSNQIYSKSILSDAPSGSCFKFIGPTLHSDLSVHRPEKMGGLQESIRKRCFQHAGPLHETHRQ